MRGEEKNLEARGAEKINRVHHLNKKNPKKPITFFSIFQAAALPPFIKKTSPSQTQAATFPPLALEKQKREPRQLLFSPSHVPAGRPWHFEGGSQDQEPRPSLSFPVGAGRPPLIWQQKTREPKEPQSPLLPFFLWFSPWTSQGHTHINLHLPSL